MSPSPLLSACMAVGGASAVCALLHALYFRFFSGSSKAGAENSNSNSQNEEDTVDARRKLAFCKQFDTVEDGSDHHYYNNLNTNPNKPWTNKILKEWKILEENLPETIFARGYESRMDLMHAAIIGADGTPYHDGIFFFDIMFPSSYPRQPPMVWYRFGGLRLNPNLYSNGTVCLGLLGTWSGSENERWLPHKSTMLQVLLSIQALILNSKPYFNEPGNEARRGSTLWGKLKWEKYNEQVFILSIKTMIYSIQNPPKHFEDLVAGHFGTWGIDILKVSRDYMEGAKVGSDIQKIGKIKGSNSTTFKSSLGQVVEVLTKALNSNDRRNRLHRRV